MMMMMMIYIIKEYLNVVSCVKIYGKYICISGRAADHSHPSSAAAMEE
jgi:hypothetical protein